MAKILITSQDETTAVVEIEDIAHADAIDGVYEARCRVEGCGWTEHLSYDPWELINWSEAHIDSKH